MEFVHSFFLSLFFRCFVPSSFLEEEADIRQKIHDWSWACPFVLCWCFAFVKWRWDILRVCLFV